MFAAQFHEQKLIESINHVIIKMNSQKPQRGFNIVCNLYDAEKRY